MVCAKGKEKRQGKSECQTRHDNNDKQEQQTLPQAPSPTMTSFLRISDIVISVVASATTSNDEKGVECDERGRDGGEQAKPTAFVTLCDIIQRGSHRENCLPGLFAPPFGPNPFL